MTTTKQRVPSLRFPEFRGEWEEKMLGDISKIYDGTHQTPKYVDSGVPFLSVEHLTANQFKKTKFISEDVFKKECKRVSIERGDVLMTRIGDIGTAKYIDWDIRSSFYVSLSLIKPNTHITGCFLALSIQDEYFQRELWRRTIHVAFPKKINLGEIGLCKILTPGIDEQRKIASFLTSVDTKIEALTKKKELLEQYKKGMMQKLFSQEIRFKDEEGKDYPDWEEKKISDIGYFYYGKSAPKFSLSDDAPTPCVRYGEMYSKYSIQITDIISKTNTPESNLKFSVGGEVLVPRVGEKPTDFAKHCCLLTRPNIAIGEMISVFNTKENSLYITYYFRTLVKEFAQVVEGANVSNLYYSYLEPIVIFIPSRLEQQKIADFLSVIDIKIGFESEELEKVKSFKKGLLQQMFV